jgi:hypothetical protein
MNPAATGFAGRYLRLVLLSLALGLAAAGIGYFPTRRLGGDGAVAAMFAGCALAVLSGWIGGLVACVPGGSGAQQINRVLGATALRMAAAAGLTVATVLAGLFATKPLLVWVALTYLVTLAGETILMVRWMGHDSSMVRDPQDEKFGRG